MKFINFLFLLVIGSINTQNVSAQCTALGQNPNTAFPVCGTTSFQQLIVPICSGPGLFVPGCTVGGGSSYDNKNSFWYKFTCYQSGTLSFLIKPNTPSDDYDWQLYDVTGINPSDVFANPNNIVTGNWAGTYGNTGASATGVAGIECGSSPADNKPTFAASPNLVVGHNYLLLIVHFDNTQSGYSLSFGGGSAVITDPLEPHLLLAKAPCDGTEIRIKLNKKMKCNSIATDGSDFTVIGPLGNILNPISALADECSGGFDFDSLSIFMAAPLSVGTYTVKVKNGIDGNTLKDNCDREIPIGEAQSFTVFPLFPTPMDSLTTPKCAPDSLVLIFKKGIKCSTIEPGGTDFFITGPYPVTIISASVICTRGVSNKIVLKLSAPMQVGGTFFVNLKTGTDGNTIFDECDVQTPLPDDVAFEIKDTVNADFNFIINYACKINTINYTYPSNSVTNWTWTFGSAPNSTLQNPVITYTNFEPKITTLIVTNGVCTATASKPIIFDNYLKAGFEVTPVICPTNPAAFKNTSVGNINAWQWIFGNGTLSADKNLLPQTYTPNSSSDYNAIPQLIITNNYGCNDTVSAKVKVVYSCFIAVPTAFTPNGDKVNDYLYPLKAYKSTNLRFSVYDRFGNRLFLGTDWQQKWDGKYKGEKQNAGTYVWTLEYTNMETNKAVFEKGTSILIR